MRTTWRTRASLVTGLLVLCTAVSHPQGDELHVTNVQVQQRPFSALVDVVYDLETIGDFAVTVRLFLSTDSGISYPHLCQAVSGDVDSGVLPGTSRQIVWDAGVEFPGFSSPTCRLRVTADDGGNLDGFVYATPGTFAMGSPPNEMGRSSNETKHQVTLTHGFYVQRTEVTNQQYMELAQWATDNGYATATSASLSDNLDGSTQELLDLNSSYSEVDFLGGVFTCVNPDHPVKEVTWYGAVAYCDWLSLQKGLTRAYNHSTWQCNGGDPYTAAGCRLPTEAEWEYACRADSTTALANGPITYIGCIPPDPNLNQMGWYCANAENWTHPVAQKTSNAWGLYDMHGNLYEWCNDWYALYSGDVTDPVGAATGSYLVIRGGFCEADAGLCRSAFRFKGYPGSSTYYIGFRCVRTAD